MTTATLSPAADPALSLENAIGIMKARLGLIIPSGNRMTEAHFRHFAPKGFGFHVARMQMTGDYWKPLPELLTAIAQVSRTLADGKVDLIGFHCTATSMEHGTEGDARMLATIAETTGIPALSVAQAAIGALRAVGIRRMVLVTPYDQATNDHEKDYLRAQGFEVVHDVALGKAAAGHHIHSPATWLEVSLAADRKNADGYFLSCTNTTQIDIIERLERETGKPVVNSNQAMIWAALSRLAPKLGPVKPIPGLGRLMTVGA